jgi:ribosomal-protein-serine acetyltransferase
MDRTDAAEPRGSVTEPPRIKAALVEVRLHLDEHTWIRLLRSDDADAVYDAVQRNREHLTPWMTWLDRVVDASDVYSFVRTAQREAFEHTAFKAGIWRMGHLAGFIDLHDIDWGNGHASIGYWLDRTFTGQGLMTAAVRLMTEYAFEALDLHRVEIHVATENYRSRRIPERLGFKLEGVLRGVQRLRGVHVDHAIYALLRDEKI